MIVLKASCRSAVVTWWHHQMETFSALLAICAGNSPATGEFPAQRPVTRSFDVFFDLHLNIWLSKQWWGWWFETLSHPLWRYCNGMLLFSNHSRSRPVCNQIGTGWHFNLTYQGKVTHMVQIMACELFRAMHDLNKCLLSGNLTLR